MHLITWASTFKISWEIFAFVWMNSPGPLSPSHSLLLSRKFNHDKRFRWCCRLFQTENQEEGMIRRNLVTGSKFKSHRIIFAWKSNDICLTKQILSVFQLSHIYFFENPIILFFFKANNTCLKLRGGNYMTKVLLNRILFFKKSQSFVWKSRGGNDSTKSCPRFQN